jgi:hypothetical protein
VTRSQSPKKPPWCSYCARCIDPGQSCFDWPTYTPMIIVTTGDLPIKRLKTHLPTWETKGFNNVKDATLYQSLLSTLWSRQAPRIFWKGIWSQNHSAHGVRMLASVGSRSTDPINLGVSPEKELTGAILSSLSQAQAYQMILDNKPKAPFPATERNMQIIKESVGNLRQKQPTNASTWKATQSTTLCRRVQNFNFNMIHNSLKTGNFFKHIPNCEHRVNCPRCETTDSIEHILLNCQSSHCEIVWNTVKSIWPVEFAKPIYGDHNGSPLSKIL